MQRQFARINDNEVIKYFGDMNMDLDRFIPQSEFLRFFYGIFVTCLLTVLLVTPGYIFRDSAGQAYMFAIYLFLPFAVGVTSAYIFGDYQGKAVISLLKVLYAELCLIFVFITLNVVFQVGSYVAAGLILYSPIPIILTAAGASFSNQILIRS